MRLVRHDMLNCSWSNGPPIETLNKFKCEFLIMKKSTITHWRKIRGLNVGPYKDWATYLRWATVAFIQTAHTFWRCVTYQKAIEYNNIGGICLVTGWLAIFELGRCVWHSAPYLLRKTNTQRSKLHGTNYSQSLRWYLETEDTMTILRLVVRTARNRNWRSISTPSQTLNPLPRARSRGIPNPRLLYHRIALSSPLDS